MTPPDDRTPSHQVHLSLLTSTLHHEAFSPPQRQPDLTAPWLDQSHASPAFPQDPRSTAVVPADSQHHPSGPMAAPKPGQGPTPDPALLALCFPTGAVGLAQIRPGGKPRNGKIAHLPKLEREMVNRMLANNIPHHKIAAALDDLGLHVTARNVSNWKTRGGYTEWRAAQAQALELRPEMQVGLPTAKNRPASAEISQPTELHPPRAGRIQAGPGTLLNTPFRRGVSRSEGLGNPVQGFLGFTLPFEPS